MDALARIHPAALPLLDRVDQTLQRLGAAEHDPIWPVLRRLRREPGAAVAELAACSPEPWRERAELLRSKHAAWAEVSASIAVSPGWEGAAGSAFAGKLQRVRRELQLRIDAAQHLAAQFDQLAAWVSSGRDRLARSLARSITSAEAVDLTAEAAVAAEVTLPVRAGAAARIGWLLLTEVEQFWRDGADLSRSFESALNESALTDPALTEPQPGAETSAGATTASATSVSATLRVQL